MLRKYQNAFVQEILASGLDAALFHSEDAFDAKHPSFTVYVTNTDLRFVARNPVGDFEAFDYYYTQFTAGFPDTDYIPKEGYLSGTEVLKAFRAWLDDDIRPALEDLALPDLWAQVNEAGTMLARSARPVAPEHFSAEEREQVRVAMSQFELLVFCEFDPGSTEREVISQQLRYLVDAVDRLNKFDWHGTALNTLIGITVTLSLDTERGRQLFGLFPESFRLRPSPIELMTAA